MSNQFQSAPLAHATSASVQPVHPVPAFPPVRRQFAKQAARLTAFTLLLAAAAFPQVPKSHGYVVQGFGQVDSHAFAHTAFGGEGSVWKGVAIGGEIGAGYGINNSFPPTIGFANFSGGYHFTAGRKDTKFDPFVMAGPTFAFRNGTGWGWHLGAGMNYWFKERLGIRAEFRTNTISSDLNTWPQFRIGITFR